MTQSNTIEADARSSLKHLFSRVKSGAKGSAVKSCVRHARVFVCGSAGRRFAAHSAADVVACLGERGRIGRVPAWQLA